MIVDAIVAVLTSLVTGVLGLVPSYTLPTSVTEFSAGLGASLAGLNGVLPVSTVGACLLVIIGVQLFLLVWDLLVLVYQLIPFKLT